MLLNYFKIAVRHLIKHKGFSFINVAGLAVGIACSMLILLWISDELSYDKFHADADRMYRINLHLPDMDIRAAVSSTPMAEASQNEIPEIVSTMRLNPDNDDLFQVDDKIFDEKQITYADSNFFDFFSFKLIEGDKKTALALPENIVLTEEMAIKYFGTTKIVARTMRKSNKDQDVIVSGVMENVPSTSHLQFDFIEPMSMLARTHDDLKLNRWDNFGWYTYVKLDKPATPEKIASINKQIGDIYHKNEEGMKANFFLSPMTEIHLTPGLLGDFPGITDSQYIYIFGIVGLFIIAVACINFMNLATARSARRAKEVGLRKVAGAVRTQLVRQFLTESLVIAVAALIIAFAIVAAVLPLFNELTGKTLSNDLFNPKLVGGLALITLITGLLAGSYPAIFLSGFAPAKVLKGELASSGTSKIFRNTMVVIQFSISITLLVGTAVVFRQMQFISNRNIGYDKENLIHLPIKGDLGKDKERLRTMLESTPSTSDFTVTSSVPTNMMNGTISVKWDGKDPEAQPLFPNMAIDENFVRVFKMTLLYGRSFERDVKGDTASYVVNEEALKIMNMDPETAVGKRLALYNNEGKIIGVIKNFNFKPVQSAIEPLILQVNPGYGELVIRTKPGQLDQTLADLKKIHDQLNPKYPFAYDFVDQDLDKMYKAEQRLGRLFSIFAVLGLLISCLGLYGLSAFLAERRTKEIGVRKVLGASVFSITWLLSKTFARPIMVAALIATPLSWYAMDSWLKSFVYRVDIGWEVFVVAFVVSMLIAMVTVSYETVRAAFTNPSRSLKSE